MFDARTYEPAGPTTKRFHESSAFYRPLAGPIGSGKTVAAGVAEVIFAGMVQEPQADGVRRVKVGMLRDTYRNLYATSLKTWHDWIPREVGRFVGSDDRPAIHEFTLQTPIGECEISYEMRALGPNTVEAVARGWELNGAYGDEADLMPQEAITYMGGRVKRAGRKDSRRSRGVWFTFNKPDVDHWIYDICVENKMEGLEFFDQPGGLLDGGPPYITNPKAENLQNLDDDYYTQSAQGQPEWYIRRMLRNKWGSSVAGDVIYPEFQPDLHISPIELEPPPRMILQLGADGGGTPAAALAGRDDYGRVIVYGEVVLTDPTDPRRQRLLTGVGPKRFARAIKDVLSEPRFASCQVQIGYGDPAAFYGADREDGEYSFMETVAQELGVGIIPADSNEIHIRQEAVRGLLTTLGGDGRPMLIVNPSCRFIRRGFQSDYKLEMRDPKQPGKRLKPQKSATSHVHDALQYLCLGMVGRAGVTGGRAYDRWQPKKGLLVPTSPGIETPWGRPQGVVKGTHYQVDFNLWS